MRVLTELHPSLSKYSNRSREYLRIEKMLAQHHHVQIKDKGRQGLPSEHDAQLLQRAEELLLNK